MRSSLGLALERGDLVVHTFDPNTQEAEAGGGQVLSQPGLDPVSKKMVGGQRQEGHFYGGE